MYDLDFFHIPQFKCLLPRDHIENCLNNRFIKKKQALLVSTQQLELSCSLFVERVLSLI